jgi:transcription antitermination protein NusB
MSRRSKARETVLQLLFQDDLNRNRVVDQDGEFLASRLQNDKHLIDFADHILAGVRQNKPEIDQLLRDLSENWSLERMAATDRNVLRIGAFEILFDKTPVPVVIDEAVRLARRYGDKTSSSFVNGILDRIKSFEHRLS